LQHAADVEAEEHDDVAVIICDCGEPDYACCCIEMAAKFGECPDSTKFLVLPEEPNKEITTKNPS
jgi:hypothetical protein